jgi:hypothetical protein
MTAFGPDDYACTFVVIGDAVASEEFNRMGDVWIEYEIEFLSPNSKLRSANTEQILDVTLATESSLASQPGALTYTQTDRGNIAAGKKIANIDYQHEYSGTYYSSAKDRMVTDHVITIPVTPTGSDYLVDFEYVKTGALLYDNASSSSNTASVSSFALSKEIVPYVRQTYGPTSVYLDDDFELTETPEFDFTPYNFTPGPFPGLYQVTDTNLSNLVNATHTQLYVSVESEAMVIYKAKGDMVSAGDVLGIRFGVNGPIEIQATASGRYLGFSEPIPFTNNNYFHSYAFSRRQNVANSNARYTDLTTNSSHTVPNGISFSEFTIYIETRPDGKPFDNNQVGIGIETIAIGFAIAGTAIELFKEIKALFTTEVRPNKTLTTNYTEVPMVVGMKNTPAVQPATRIPLTQ